MQYQAELLSVDDAVMGGTQRTLVVRNVPIVSETHPTQLKTEPYIYKPEHINSMFDHITELEVIGQSVYLPIFSIHKEDDYDNSRHTVGYAIPTKKEYLDGFGLTIFGDFYIAKEGAINGMLSGCYSSWSAEVLRIKDEVSVGRELSGIALLNSVVPEYPYTPINRETIIFSPSNDSVETNSIYGEDKDRVMLVHSKVKKLQEEYDMDNENVPVDAGDNTETAPAEEVVEKDKWEEVMAKLESIESMLLNMTASPADVVDVVEEVNAATHAMDACHKRMLNLAQRFHSKPIEVIEKLVKADLTDDEIGGILSAKAVDSFSRVADVEPRENSNAVDSKLAKAIDEYNKRYKTSFKADSLSASAVEVFKRLIK